MHLVIQRHGQARGGPQLSDQLGLFHGGCTPESADVQFSITETVWLIEARLGSSAEVTILPAIQQSELTRIDLFTQDWARVIDLVEPYADLGLGTVDASIVAIAERLAIDEIATLNRRDFAIVRPSHIPVSR